jgi:hypothetical protein
MHPHQLGRHEDQSQPRKDGLSRRELLAISLCFSLLAALTACGGGGSATPIYTLGGTVTGLKGTVVLQDSGGQLSVSADGSFTFPASVTGGSVYTVSVLTQPTNETCAVAGASGTANSNVTSIAVTCTLGVSDVGTIPVIMDCARALVTDALTRAIRGGLGSAATLSP